MADLDNLARLVTLDHGLAVVSLGRGEGGGAAATVVNAGVLPHPRSGEPVVGFVAAGGSAKLRRLRQRPVATVTVRAGWQWVTVEGAADLMGPDDPVDGVDVPALLRQVFIAAGGTHDDWAAYDRVMADERRAAVLVHPERVYGIAG